MTQPSFFDRYSPLDAASLPRLSRQCAAILARLEQGPATNDELSRIARKYTGRISDLRHAGYDVRCTSQDRTTGLAVYELGVL